MKRKLQIGDWIKTDRPTAGSDNYVGQIDSTKLWRGEVLFRIRMVGQTWMPTRRESELTIISEEEAMILILEMK